jgi:hypothetical protein
LDLRRSQFRCPGAPGSISIKHGFYLLPLNSGGSNLPDIWVLVMNAVPLVSRPAISRFSVVEGETRRSRFGSVMALRIAFWSVGLVLAAVQAWIFRFQVSADSISYLDMSDAVMPGGNWHRIITGTWSPLYPFILGCFRRLFRISPGNEIAAGHGLNLFFFVFAFVSFEVFLRSLRPRLQILQDRSESRKSPLPEWAYFSLAYSAFLWASISAISLEKLRPDMLMSGFVYLAAALLLEMRGRANWARYLQMGVLLGVAFLAKAPMLPLGLLILGLSLFMVENWHAALRMSVISAGLIFLIGSLYFVPLSISRGHFTLGESGPFNYLVHVDGAGPSWYLENPGEGVGNFRHPPRILFAPPPVYAFPVDTVVTHPLRFDPAWWMSGVRPHVDLGRQIAQSLLNLYFLKQILLPLFPLAAGILILAIVSQARRVGQSLSIVWPVCLIGIAGFAMYVVVHVEARYVGVFAALLACAVLRLFVDVPGKANQYASILGTLLITGSLLVPVALDLNHSDRQFGHDPNADFAGAEALKSLGIRSNDDVARISPVVNDLGIERIARVGVVSEVDLGDSQQFWNAPRETQRQILSLFAKAGAKAVIATSPQLTNADRDEWIRLANTHYWVWLPPRS